jgi:hypothetical protein
MHGRNYWEVVCREGKMALKTHVNSFFASFHSKTTKTKLKYSYQVFPSKTVKIWGGCDCGYC